MTKLREVLSVVGLLFDFVAASFQYPAQGK
jgi:hypothetical protein